MLLGEKRKNKQRSLLFTTLRTKPKTFSDNLLDSEKDFVASIMLLGFPCFAAEASRGARGATSGRLQIRAALLDSL